MDIFKAFATDPKLELEGRWVRIGGTDEEPAELLVARLGTKRYNAVLAQQREANKTLLDSKDKPAAEAKLDDIICHTLATCVLLGWRGITYKGDAAYSYDSAKAMLALRDFRDLVEVESYKFQSYLLDQQDADAKNS